MAQNKPLARLLVGLARGARDGEDDGRRIDKLDIARAIGSDSRVGPKCLLPGFGFGGPCFPRDGRGADAAVQPFALLLLKILAKKRCVCPTVRFKRFANQHAEPSRLPSPPLEAATVSNNRLQTKQSSETRLGERS